MTAVWPFQGTFAHIILCTFIYYHICLITWEGTYLPVLFPQCRRLLASLREHSWKKKQHKRTSTWKPTSKMAGKPRRTYCARRWRLPMRSLLLYASQRTDCEYSLYLCDNRSVVYDPRGWQATASYTCALATPLSLETTGSQGIKLGSVASLESDLNTGTINFARGILTNLEQTCLNSFHARKMEKE